MHYPVSHWHNSPGIFFHVLMYCIWHVYPCRNISHPFDYMSIYISTVPFKYTNNLRNFPQSPSVLHNTLVHKYDITNSTSNLARFDTCNNFYTSWWKAAALPLFDKLDFLYKSLSNKYIFAGVFAHTIIFLQNSQTHLWYP